MQTNTFVQTVQISIWTTGSTSKEVRRESLHGLYERFGLHLICFQNYLWNVLLQHKESIKLFFLHMHYSTCIFQGNHTANKQHKSVRICTTFPRDTYQGSNQRSKSSMPTRSTTLPKRLSYRVQQLCRVLKIGHTAKSLFVMCCQRNTRHKKGTQQIHIFLCA